ncbi:potassium channel family protein [Bradyrhizobium erythrophlei]|uniref:potassium channel family protein n=1 Tax=Bradyrhizobium erythrophlei TaxID=1437360 RepID=UPI0035EFD095
MLRQIAFASAVSLANIAIHAAAMALVIGAARATTARWPSASTSHLVAVMMATVAVLMAAHSCEVMVWSLAYALVDVVPEGTDRVYFAFVNFTTLGYGDIVPVARWRLLGPMTAMNGVLLFGWSTAVIFEVLRTALRKPA